MDRFFNVLENFQESPAQLAALKDPVLMAQAAKELSESE